jgi:hypothetical protein
MFRAGLKFLRHLFCAAILLVLIVCGAEVGVRVAEMAGKTNFCESLGSKCPVDPADLLVPSWLTHRELKPHSMVNVTCLDSKRDVPIRTNSFGLRGPEVIVPKPRGLFRIVLLGDETVFAPETPESEHVVSLLETLLQQQAETPIEIVNAGLPGGCPLTEYLLFKQRLLALQPDLVLMHFDWSDVSEDQLLRRFTRVSREGGLLSCPHTSLVKTKRVTQPLDELRRQFRLIDWGLSVASQQWKQKLAEQTAVTRDVTANPYAWLREERPASMAAMKQAFQPISDLAALSDSGQFQLAIVTSPKPWQVSPRCSAGKGCRMAAGVANDAYFPSRVPFDSLAQFVIGLRLQYADATVALTNDADADANYLRRAPRWSPEGHRRMAEFLASFLSERVSGPWSSRYLPGSGSSFSRRSQPAAPVQWVNGER